MGAYLSLIGKGGGGESAYSRLGTYELFLPLGYGRLFEVGANSKLGAYSNKHGSSNNSK